MPGQCALVSSNFATWGPCFQDAVFFGSPIVTLIGVIAIFTWLSFKLNLPHEVSLLLASGSTLMFAVVFPSDPAVTSLAAVSAVITIAYFARGFIRSFRILG